MKPNGRLRVRAILPVVLALCWAFAGPAQAVVPQERDSVTVWAAPDAQKIRPKDAVESSNLVWSTDQNRIRVSGAGNEHVPFQVVITRPKPDGYEPAAPDGFFLRASDLVSQSGHTIPSAQIDVYLEHFIYVYGKSSPVGDTGYWPDALVPLKEPFGMEAEYGMVRNRPLWVDVHVPSHTPAGTYTGDLTVTRHGRPVATLKLELEIHDFSLPDRTHLAAYMDASQEALARFYGNEPSSTENWNRTKRYIAFLDEHRMALWMEECTQIEPRVRVEDQEVTVTFDDEAIEYFIEKLDYRTFTVDTYPAELAHQIDADPFTARFNDLVRAYLQAVEEYAKKGGWNERLVFVSPIDEPNSEAEYERTRQWGRLVDRATDVPFMATESPVPQNPEWGTLRDAVDNFVIHGNALNDPAVKTAITEEMAAGNEMTWYISCDQGYPQPNYFIDAPAMDPLMVPWITARYGMNGILYWEINHWVDSPNPWLDPVTFNSGHLCSGGYVLNGEGYLVYPGDYADDYTDQPPVEGPVSSVRLELLREGIEDYEYLWMLRTHGAEEFARKQIQDRVVDVRAFSRNLEELYYARKAMADRLEKITQ